MIEGGATAGVQQPAARAQLVVYAAPGRRRALALSLSSFCLSLTESQPRVWLWLSHTHHAHRIEARSVRDDASRTLASRSIGNTFIMLSRLFCCCSSSSTPPQAHEIQALYNRTGGNGSSADAAAELRLFVAMWCRSSAERFSLQKQLVRIGARQAKVFSWVQDGEAGGGGMIGWLFLGSNRAVLSVSSCEQTIGMKAQAIEQVLMVSHPVLLPIRLFDVSRPGRAVILRDWCPAGSIRDMLHSAKPEDDQAFKYDRVGTPLSEAKIASLGRALLEALVALRPLGSKTMEHIHLGNLFLDDSTVGMSGGGGVGVREAGFLGGGGGGGVPRAAARTAILRIAEWEQGVLGLPSHQAAYFADLCRCLEPAACALALCVYEMACGFELDGLPPVIPPACPRVVREALCEMLSPPLKGKDKGGSPREKRPACLTLEDCRLLPLFSGAGGPSVALEWEPLPQEVVQAVQDFANNSNACSPRRESSHGI